MRARHLTVTFRVCGEARTAHLDALGSDRGRWLRNSTRQKKVAAPHLLLRQIEEKHGAGRRSRRKRRK